MSRLRRRLLRDSRSAFAIPIPASFRSRQTHATATRRGCRDFGSPPRAPTGIACPRVICLEFLSPEGAIVSQTPEVVRVRKADGTEVDLAESEIAGRRKGLSAMPEGLRQFVSREHMRDLIEHVGRL